MLRAISGDDAKEAKQFIKAAFKEVGILQVTKPKRTTVGTY